MRRKVDNLKPFQISAEQAAAAASIDKLVGGSARKKNSSIGTKSYIKRKVAEIELRVAEANFRPTPGEFVALYYLLHTNVYGSEPVELRGDEWHKASIAAGNMLSDEFGGNSAEMVLFVRWAWRRERIGEERAQRGNSSQNRRRITWRLQFAGKYLLSDYRVEMVRKLKSRNIYGSND